MPSNVKAQDQCGHRFPNMLWKRLIYFSVGFGLTPILFSLALLVLCLLPIQTPKQQFAIVTVSGFFLLLGILTASAVRAGFRNPPWWIISPQKTREATLKILIDRLLKLDVKTEEDIAENGEDFQKLADQCFRVVDAEPTAPEAEKRGRSGMADLYDIPSPLNLQYFYLEQETSSQPIIKWVNLILHRACWENVSQISLLSDVNNGCKRFRILFLSNSEEIELESAPWEMLDPVANRLYTMANLPYWSKSEVEGAFGVVIGSQVTTWKLKSDGLREKIILYKT